MQFPSSRVRLRTLVLCGAREQPASLMHQAAFLERVGEAHICGNIQDALKRAEEPARSEEKLESGLGDSRIAS